MISDIWGGNLSRFHLQAFVNTVTKFQISSEQGVSLQPEKRGPSRGMKHFGISYSATAIKLICFRQINLQKFNE
jgi:hypothetical protein